MFATKNRGTLGMIWERAKTALYPAAEAKINARHGIRVRPEKLELALSAIRKHDVKTFADIGACWGVHAGYTRSILEVADIEKAYVVDQFITERTLDLGNRYPQIQYVNGIFNRRDFIRSFPEVDALIMYDILLHQVDLDWDEFLREWSKKARVLIIFNQMWKKGEKTIRFPDQGREWFKENVFFTSEEKVDEWFDTLNETDQKTGKIRKDLHSFWQFGIVTDDLIQTVKACGFKLDYYRNHGSKGYGDRPWIQEEAFVFVNDEARPDWP